MDGVAEVHDLHVWGIKPGMPILAAHITTEPGKNGNAVLSQVTQYCKSIGIDHSTIQISDDCTACPCNTYADGNNAATNQRQQHSHGEGGEGHAHTHNHSHHDHSGGKTANGHSHAAHSQADHEHDIV